jgi:uncharacterized damage-inducible protein DinB
MLAMGLALVVSPAVAEAQMGRGGGGMQDGEMPPLAAARIQYESVRDLILRTARGVPAEVLAYRPTEEVRSFSELLGHVANASFMFCSVVLDEDSPSSTNYEELTDQAGLVAGLEEAFAYCDRAHTGLSGRSLMEDVSLFGQTGSRIWVLVFNATHNWEHYGNLVTYMRLNGIVPPSSGGLAGN